MGRLRFQEMDRADQPRVASGNLLSRLGFAVQLRARAQGDGGSPYAVLALYLRNGVLRQSRPCSADGCLEDPTSDLESRIGLSLDLDKQRMLCRTMDVIAQCDHGSVKL